MVFKKLLAMGLAVAVCSTNICPAFAENGGGYDLTEIEEISSVKSDSQVIREEAPVVYGTSHIKDTDYKYQVVGGYIYFDKAKGTITGCDASVTSADIPNEIDGVRVTAIGTEAFDGCSSLTSITIPDGVTSIGDYAFSGCSSLTSITIPDGVTSIGSYAFYGCSGLTSITIPDGVTRIGISAFYGCSSLTSITIPEGVTSIGIGAFEGCSGLKTAGPVGGDYDYKFGWKTGIPDYAFNGCSGLTSITIPEGVTSIGVCQA